MWLRTLSEHDKREKEGFYMAVESLAADKERARLADFHEFEDGMVDQPLLNSETLITDNE